MKKLAEKPVDNKLLEAFDAFNDFSSRLREAYLSMKERAAAIDLKLAETNKKLQRKVEELDNLTSYLNALLTSMPSGVVTTDLEGKIKTINPSGQCILELSPGDILGKGPGRVRDKSGAPAFSRFLCEEDSEPGNEERKVVLPSGTTAYINSSVSYLCDARNNPIGKVEILNDITDLVNLRKKVHSLDKLAALGEMAAGISHEIRNPLNAIEGFTSLLKRGYEKDPTNPKTGEYILKIQQGVRRLDGIVNTFLSFARPDKLRVRTFPVIGLLREVKEIVPELEVWKRRNSCPVKIHPCSQAVKMEGDFLKLKHALLNLVTNGIAALNGSGGISLRARDLGREVSFRVCDSGRGMTPEEMEKIFHPFYTNREDGTGLGLPIVNKIIELHAGRIKTWSRKGRGTVFTVTLPKKQRSAVCSTAPSERRTKWQ